MKKSLEMLRSDFPMLANKEYVYLDNAATTHKPQSVIDSMVNFYSNEYATTGRGVYPLAEQATKKVEDARIACAQFINALSAKEIVFTSGATDSISMVAYAWALENITSNNVIVLSELEHHANLLPWQWVAQKTGAQLRYIPVGPNGDLLYDMLDEIINDQVALVAITHTSNALGVAVDCQKIIARARSVGAKTLVDASQAMIHSKIDVQGLDCDFLAFSGHKMLGPTGIGVLYVKKALHPNLSPFRRGGGMIHSASYSSATWAKMPHLLEAGTPPVAQIIGLHAAIAYINQNIDWKDLFLHEVNITSHAIYGLSKIPSITLIGPIDFLRNNGHQIAFLVENIHAHDLAAMLGAQGICVRAGNHCAQPLSERISVLASVRASFAFYNTKKEVDQLIQVIQDISL